MIDVSLSPSFLKKYKKLSPELQGEVRAKIKEFQDPANHEALRVHKLQGRMKGRYSFSVNYKYRIVFHWIEKNTEAYLLVVGDHSIYT